MALLSFSTHRVFRWLAISLTLCSPFVGAAQLRFEGVLGNSGDSGDELVTFSEKSAAGLGPVFDDENTIWERAVYCFTTGKTRIIM